MDTITLAEFAVATLIPILVGLVTKEVASQALKSILLALLSGAAAVATAYVDSAGVLTSETLTLFVQNFVIAVAAYYGFWKPTQVAPAVQHKTATFGIGPKNPPK